jgi:uncharacterized protein with von Willebrand factor type A (vWA) domain
VIQRKTELSANIVAFCRFLRQKGLPVGVTEETEALQALTVLPFTDRDSFRLTLRAIIPRSYPHQKLFDELYREYWKNLEKAVDSKTQDKPEEKEKPAPKKNPPPSIQSLKNWLYGNSSDEELETATYSAATVLTQKDFSTLNEEELREVMQLVKALARTFALRYQRRYQATHHPKKLDVLRTVRNNLRRGGEIISLAYKKPRQQPLKLVMLCDVSKSMDLYSQFLIQFIYSFQQVYRQIETFVFSTSLHYLTPQIEGKRLPDVLQQLAEQVPDWSGGTKIGASFHRFITDYGRSKLDRRTLVLILSDGWDTGDIELLEKSMEYIHRHSAGVIWLNPLAGSTDYQPRVQGMKAAMPFIDVFAPVHNVDSLRSLARHLRTFRRKRVHKASSWKTEERSGKSEQQTMNRN